MKCYQPNTTLTLINDPQDFKMPYFAYSKFEGELYKYYYNRLTNAEIGLLAKPIDILTGNFEEGVY